MGRFSRPFARQYACNSPISSRGFSLVETMMAVAVFSIAVIGCLTMLTIQGKLIHKTQEKVYVDQILESRLEEIRHMDFENELHAMTGTTTFPISPSTTVNGKPVNPDIDDEEFLRVLENAVGTAKVTNINSSMKLVELEIAWKSAQSGRSISMKTSTYITKDGVGAK